MRRPTGGTLRGPFKKQKSGTLNQNHHSELLPSSQITVQVPAFDTRIELTRKSKQEEAVGRVSVKLKAEYPPGKSPHRDGTCKRLTVAQSWNSMRDFLDASRLCCTSTGQNFMVFQR